MELLQAGVHEVEGEADDDGGNDDADHEGNLLKARRGADEVAGLEILRGVTRVRGGDADDASDGDCEGSEGWVRPSHDKEDGGSGHEGGDGHPGDRAGRAADETDDTRADGDEEKAEDDHQQRGGQVGSPAYIGSGNGLELEENEHEGDDKQGADDDDGHGEVVFSSDGFGFGG